MKVYVHFADGFEEIEAITVLDVLRRAGIDAQSVSVTGNLLVMGAHSIPIKADALFDDAAYEDCDMIVLPGGMPGSTGLWKHQGLAEKIRNFSAQGKWLAAICAAPMVFGQMGLLKGRKAICYPGFEDKLLGAKIGKHNVEIDGKIITSKGPGTAMEFALTLVEVLQNKEAVKNLRESMQIE